MKRLLRWIFESKDKEHSGEVKRRRNGSPYVDPDALFEHVEVQRQIRQLDASLSKMEQSNYEKQKEKVAG